MSSLRGERERFGVFENFATMGMFSTISLHVMTEDLRDGDQWFRKKSRVVEKRTVLWLGGTQLGRLLKELLQVLLSLRKTVYILIF